MNVESRYPVMIFRKDFENGESYSVGLNKKKQDGSYENGYMQVRFKKGVELENKTSIYIKNAFLTFYIGGEPRKTMPYIMITDYELANKQEKTNSAIIKDAMENKDPYEAFGTTIEDNALPF